MRWPGRRLLAAACVGGALAAPTGWLVTDRLEQDDDFCNACHLEPGLPLHLEIRRGFDARPPASLAGRHAAAGNRAREDAGFRCIDCHGGVSLAGRLRVKALAAKDAFWYGVGRFDEPSAMRWPLWDEDCTRCHARFDEERPRSWETPRFHQLAVHNVELGVACVECHEAHETGGAADVFFLRPACVRLQCARCHTEFEEGAL